VSGPPRERKRRRTKRRKRKRRSSLCFGLRPWLLVFPRTKDKERRTNHEGGCGAWESGEALRGDPAQRRVRRCGPVGGRPRSECVSGAVRGGRGRAHRERREGAAGQAAALHELEWPVR